MSKSKILAPFGKPKPWRRGRAHPARREVAILDKPPLAQINIYEETVIVIRRKPDHTWSSYPTSVDALAQVLGRLPVSSGLLPWGMLATGQHRGHPFYVQYIRPRPAALQVEENGRLEQRRLLTPGLIWAGWQREYRIWAIKGDPYELGRRAPLFIPPFPNTYDSGAICWGNVSLKPADPQQMGAMFRLFLEESVFNTHVAGGKSRSCPANVLRLYDTLKADGEYPLDDLVRASMSLERVIDGGWLSGVL